MPEIGTSSSMSGDGKRGDGHRPQATAPILDSTGHPMTAHWGLADPSGTEGGEVQKRLAFADTYRMLSNRIGIFLSLPVASLERMSLQRKLDEIGRMAESSGEAV
ncbi:MAG: hypothetical protein WBX25_09155 [Rhodomicrobium sp.]